MFKKLEWPSGKTFKYEFNKDLAMEIPAKDGSRKIENSIDEGRDAI